MARQKIRLNVDVDSIVDEFTLPPARIQPVKAVVPVRTTTSASLYGVLIYVYPDRILGQLLDFYEYTTVDGHRVWHITYGVSALYVRLGEDVILPIGLTGFMTPDMYDLIKVRKPMVLEFRHVFGELPQVPVDTIVNLEQVWSGEVNVLIIDPHRILGKNPKELEDAYVKAMRQLDSLRKLYSSVLGELENEKSRRVTAENQMVVYRSLVYEMRSKLSTIQEALAKNEQELLELYNRMHMLHRRVTSEAQARIEYEALLDDARSVIGSMLSSVKILNNYVNDVLRSIAQPAAQQAGARASGEEEEGEEEEGGEEVSEGGEAE